MERLDKLIASQGIGSRKEAGNMIKAGRITVDGQPCLIPDTKINPEKQHIFLDGQLIEYKKYIYIMLNKPAGVLSAGRDNHQKTVIDLLPDHLKRRGLFPAGRLDKDTEGLLIITDDGDFAHRMLSPRQAIYKVYEARLDGIITEKEQLEFAAGLTLEDGTRLRPAILRPLPERGDNFVQVVICEGKYHQVKRMIAHTGKTVLYLKRVKIGSLELDPALESGQARELLYEERTRIFIPDTEYIP